MLWIAVLIKCESARKQDETKSYIRSQKHRHLCRISGVYHISVAYGVVILWLQRDRRRGFSTLNVVKLFKRDRCKGSPFRQEQKQPLLSM